MIHVKDNDDCDVFIPEDVFEEIAESVLANIQGHKDIKGRISDIEPLVYVEIVEEAANTVHKGITGYVEDKYFGKLDFTEEACSNRVLSINDVREDLRNLFKRNMDTVAAN